MNASRILQLSDGSQLPAVYLCVSRQEREQQELVVAVSTFGDFFAFPRGEWCAAAGTDSPSPLTVVAPQGTPYDSTPWLPRPRRVYRHFKQQHLYQVQLLSTEAATGVRLVHYHALAAVPGQPLWARPLTEFLELVNSVGDGTVRRFTSVDAAAA